MFSKSCLLQRRQKASIWGKGLNSLYFDGMALTFVLLCMLKLEIRQMLLYHVSPLTHGPINWSFTYRISDPCLPHDCSKNAIKKVILRKDSSPVVNMYRYEWTVSVSLWSNYVSNFCFWYLKTVQLFPWYRQLLRLLQATTRLRVTGLGAALNCWKLLKWPTDRQTDRQTIA